MCKQQDILNEYRLFLEDLASTNSSKLFTNGGKEYASILMSVLLDKTNSIARIFSYGFRPDLVWTDPYREALNRFVGSSYKELRILVESVEAIDKEPISFLNDMFKKGNERVSVRLITEEERNIIIDQLGGGHCNFAVYDDNKFRMEYEPEKFKAFGSFNDVTTCEKLIRLFDSAFDKSTPLLPVEEYKKEHGS